MVVLTGFGMEVLKRKDRKKYDRVNAIISGGLKKPTLEHCPLCIEQECELYGTGACLGGMK
jgi:hypothetical protein